MVQDLGIRQRLEERETSLSPLASRAAQTRGRLRPEEPCSLRTDFQRDRDRIIHSKAFRRLKHKTQVFVAPQGDHFVTRLTHVLEVSQVARTISRALNLNEDLTEAIALGHDLGHTPFGHIGEAALDELLPGGFRHAEQSLRVVDRLENDGQGLNLTYEVREGIRGHSKGMADILGDEWGSSGTFEAEVVKLADIIAYVNHDANDAIRAGLLVEADLPPAAVKVLGGNAGQRIDTLVRDAVRASWAVTGAPGDGPGIRLSPTVREAANLLRDFLNERVYQATGNTPEARRARTAVRRLFRHYLADPGALPPPFSEEPEEAGRRAADYVAGMTDQFALRAAAALRRWANT
jgi:dGTPase